MKKLLALLLALIMVAGMFPMSAMAADDYPAADWYNFRSSDVNMGITSAATPKTASYTQLKWTYDFGDFVGIPVLVGEYMYIAAGSTAENSKLYKLSLADGSVARPCRLPLLSMATTAI